MIKYFWLFVLGTALFPYTASADGLFKGTWGHHLYGGTMIFGPIMMIAFFGLVVFLAVLFVRWLIGVNPATEGDSHKTALEILDERFAKGEIDKDDYQARRDTITN